MIELHQVVNHPQNPPENPPPNWRQRVVSRLHPYATSFRQGAAHSIMGVGALNALFGGLGVLQGFGTHNSKDLAIGAAALTTGIAQVYAGTKLTRPLQADCATTVGTIGGAAAGMGLGLLVLPKIILEQATVQKLAFTAKIAIGVAVETSASLICGGVATVATTFAAQKTVDLYYYCREAQARRANPEANQHLTSPQELEQPELPLDPETAT